MESCQATNVLLSTRRDFTCFVLFKEFNSETSSSRVSEYSPVLSTSLLVRNLLKMSIITLSPTHPTYFSRMHLPYRSPPGRITLHVIFASCIFVSATCKGPVTNFKGHTLLYLFGYFDRLSISLV